MTQKEGPRFAEARTAEQTIAKILGKRRMKKVESINVKIWQFPHHQSFEVKVSVYWSGNLLTRYFDTSQLADINRSRVYTMIKNWVDGVTDQ